MSCYNEDEMPRVHCNFTWITGASDPSTKDSVVGWKNLVSTSFSYQHIVYPGDHFFIFNNDKKDKSIAEECIRCITRFDV